MKSVFLGRCTRCLLTATAYNKVFETERGRYLSKKIFWICQNEDCAEYVKMKTGVWIKPFFDDGFLWTKVKIVHKN